MSEAPNDGKALTVTTDAGTRRNATRIVPASEHIHDLTIRCILDLRAPILRRSIGRRREAATSIRVRAARAPRRP